LKRKFTRVVRFADAVCCGSITNNQSSSSSSSSSANHLPLHKLDTDEHGDCICYDWDSIWYTSSDMEDMRSEARNHCQRIQQQQQQEQVQKEKDCSIWSSIQRCDDDDGGDDSLSAVGEIRGLEQRLCKERQRRKVVAIKFIVRAAAKLLSEQQQQQRSSGVAAHPAACPSTTISASEKLALIAQRCNAWATEVAISEAARDFILAYGNGNTTAAAAAANNTNKQQKRSNDERSSPSIQRNVRSKLNSYAA
jgi:hypothetical protein